MSIEVQCPACRRRYRTPDQYAGQPVTCTSCGAAMRIPDRADPGDEFGVKPAGPPPLPTPYAIAGEARPYPSAYAQAPQRKSITVPIVIACSVIGVLLVLGVIGYGAFRLIKAVGGTALGMSDAQISSAMVGTWTGVQSHPGQAPVWAELTFNADGTGQLRFSGQGKVADADVNWVSNNHVLDLTYTHIRIGNPSGVGTHINIGRIKDVTPTRLVMMTKYGDESYTHAGQPGSQPPAPFPQIPSRSLPQGLGTASPAGPGSSSPGVVNSPAVASSSQPPASPSSPVIVAPTAPPSPWAQAPSSPPAPPLTPIPPVSPAVVAPSPFPPAPPTVVAPAQQPAPADASIPSGPWKDMLAGIDPFAHPLGPAWSLSNGTLKGVSTHGYARMVLGSPPSGAYDLELTFDRTAGNRDFVILFPVGFSRGQLTVGSSNGQHVSLRGGAVGPAKANLIVNGTEQTLRLSVVPVDPNVTIRATLDGQPLLAWTGPISTLHTSGVSRPTDMESFELLVHDGATFQFKNVQARAIQVTSPYGK